MTIDPGLLIWLYKRFECGRQPAARILPPTGAQSKHRDEHFQSLLHLVPRVNEWYKRAGRQPPFKVVLTVGDQSSGKSAVVQRFVGFPVNITKKETGTRRPLKIILRNSLEHVQPKCVLDGHEMEPKQVLKEVWRINNELARQNRFEFEPLVLEVTSADVISITLIDLPGLKYTQEKSDSRPGCSYDHRQRIKDIIQDNIRGRVTFGAPCYCSYM